MFSSEGLTIGQSEADMHACMKTHTGEYVHVNIYTNIHTGTHISKYTYIRIYIYIFKIKYKHVHVCTYTYMYSTGRISSSFRYDSVTTDPRKRIFHLAHGIASTLHAQVYIHKHI